MQPCSFFAMKTACNCDIILAILENGDIIQYWHILAPREHVAAPYVQEEVKRNE